MNHHKVEQILDTIDVDDVDKVLFADGFDDAILGYDSDKKRVIYSQQRMINVLVGQGMELEEALEHLGFNVWSAYVGAHTPLYIIEVVDVDEL